MSIILKNSVKCPRCNSTSLYKFGKTKDGHQKYQCKCCKRQFAPTANTVPRATKNYPRCPVCGKATFLHHDYKHYSTYRCGDKSCYHAVKIVKPTSIDPISASILFGKTDFSRMRFPLHIILSALSMFYLCNTSTRNIKRFLYLNHQVKVSHVTIAAWTKKFAPIFDAIAKSKESSINLNSDEWHADETVVKINGQRYYLWVLIDSETRFVINFHLTPYRDASQAFSLFKNSAHFGVPSAIVTDRLPSYNIPANSIFSYSKHIRVDSFKDVISNNLIESFNDTFKTWYKSKRGFNSFESANNLIFMFVFYYNFIRPHSSLNNLSPAQVAGARYSDQDKFNWLLTA